MFGECLLHIIQITLIFLFFSYFKMSKLPLFFYFFFLFFSHSLSFSHPHAAHAALAAPLTLQPPAADGQPHALAASARPRPRAPFHAAGCLHPSSTRPRAPRPPSRRRPPQAPPPTSSICCRGRRHPRRQPSSALLSLLCYRGHPGVGLAKGEAELCFLVPPPQSAPESVFSKTLELELMVKHPVWQGSDWSRFWSRSWSPAKGVLSLRHCAGPQIRVSRCHYILPAARQI
jgi:hypothetical protein